MSLDAIQGKPGVILADSGILTSNSISINIGMGQHFS